MKDYEKEREDIMAVCSKYRNAFSAFVERHEKIIMTVAPIEEKAERILLAVLIPFTLVNLVRLMVLLCNRGGANA